MLFIFIQTVLLLSCSHLGDDYGGHLGSIFKKKSSLVLRDRCDVRCLINQNNQYILLSQYNCDFVLLMRNFALFTHLIYTVIKMAEKFGELNEHETQVLLENSVPKITEKATNFRIKVFNGR